MPQHVYLPIRNPPNWWDRVLVHPLAHAIAVIDTVFGALMTLAYPITGQVPSPAFNNVPWWLNFGAGAFLLLGGALVVVGIHWVGTNVSTGWKAELGGWTLTTGGLAAVAIAFAAGTSPAAWLIPGILTLGSLIRWWALSLIIKTARAKAATNATPGRDA